jgi:hypothetical protein
MADVSIKISTQADTAGVAKATTALERLREMLNKASTAQVEVGKAMGMGAGIEAARRAFAAISSEVSYVIQNIESIPGIDPAVREGVMDLRDNFTDVQGTIHSMTASVLNWTNQLTQGIGYGIGALVYGMDAAGEAMAEDTRQKEANRRATDLLKQAEVAAAESKRREAAAATELKQRLDALTKARETLLNASLAPDKLFEKLQMGAAKLEMDANSMERVPLDPKQGVESEMAAVAKTKEKTTDPQELLRLSEKEANLRAQLELYQKIELTRARADEMRMQAQAVWEGIVQRALSIQDAENAAAFERLSTAEKLVTVTGKLATVQELLAGNATSPKGEIEATAWMEEQNRLREERIALEALQKTLRDQAATEAKQAATEQRTIMQIALAGQLEQIRHQKEILAQAPEGIAKRQKMGELLMDERKALLDLAEAAQLYALSLPKGSAEQAQAFAEAASLLTQEKRVGSGEAPRPTKLAGAQMNAGALTDPSAHYQDNSSAILGTTADIAGQMGTTADKVGKVWGDTFQGMRSGMAAAGNEMIWQSRSVGEAIDGMGLAVAQAFTQSIVQMVADWILEHTVMAAVRHLFLAGDVAATGAATATKVATHGAGEATMTGITAAGTGTRSGLTLMETIAHGIQWAIRVGAHLLGETMSTAITLAQVPLRIAAIVPETLMWLAKAGIQAMSAMASIPYIGPFLGIAAMAAVVAAGIALMSGFYDGGYTGDGPSTQVAGAVHKQEYVLTAAETARLGVDNIEAFKRGEMPSYEPVFMQPSMPEVSMAGPVVNVGGGGAAKQQGANVIVVKNDQEMWDAIESMRGTIRAMQS